MGRRLSASKTGRRSWNYPAGAVSRGIAEAAGLIEPRPAEDHNVYPLEFVVFGNQDDPLGNPIGYYRVTQRSKRVDPQAIRYGAWKTYVRQCWQAATRRPLPRLKNGTYQLKVFCYFATPATGECNHSDPSNVYKAVEDALFAVCGDRHVSGTVDFECGYERPRLEIMVGRGAR